MLLPPAAGAASPGTEALRIDREAFLNRGYGSPGSSDRRDGSLIVVPTCRQAPSLSAPVSSEIGVLGGHSLPEADPLDESESELSVPCRRFSSLVVGTHIRVVEAFCSFSGTDRGGGPKCSPGPFRARRPTRRIDRSCPRGASTPRADAACSRRTRRLSSGVAPPGSATGGSPLESDHRSPRDRTDGAGACYAKDVAWLIRTGSFALGVARTIG